MHCVNALLLQQVRDVVGSLTYAQSARQRIRTSRIGIDY